ncbi:MAG: T9SS type A sorting domain-containing protein, partial [Bacteroidetes bacterium]|nr:T9SS type A sorting domain-containing protein [Bacteroidota bacterium]
TTVKNVGDTRAKACELVFVGPPLFMPYDQVTTIAIGDLEVGEERTVLWRMVPLRRDVGGTETLQFQVHGAGGLGDRIVVGSCGVDVYVPPARAAEYTCDVDIQSVTFDPTTGSYFPDPFLVTATMVNEGEADGMGLQGEIALENGLYLQSGQNAVQAIAQTVRPSESAQLTWMVRPIARTEDGTLTVTVTFTDRFGNATVCTETVLIPAAPEPGLVLTCFTELDALEVDKARGAYVQGTFKVWADVVNTSGRSVFDVEVAAISMDNLLKITGTNPQIVAPRLDHNAPAVRAEWDATALARTQDGRVQVLFLVSGRDEQGNPVPTRECSVWIDIPEVGQPLLRCEPRTSVTTPPDEMTISYDETRGDYEGDPSAVGDYTVFTLTATVYNDGEAQANRVRATLLLPENFTLEEGEQAIKQVSPSDIEAKKFATVSWKIRPMAVGIPVDRRFEILLTAENGEPKRCWLDVTLAEAPRLVNVDLPDDALGSYGEKVTVPVLIGETLGRDVFAYKLTVRYDPALVRFVDATSVGTMTARGWNGVKAEALTELGSTEPNLLRIEDYTTGSPLSTSRTGALVLLRFEVVHNGSDPFASDYVTQATLEFVNDVVVAEGGRRLLGSMNSVRDDETGDITLAYSPGMVTVSGDCIVPLSSSTILEQNVPNPFNPATVIRYTLGIEGDYTLTLFDALGRKVRTLEQGHRAAGEYEYMLDASSLPSGVYLYRLDTQDFTDTKRMVVSK